MRGGYGINYNTSQYATFALRLASEPPFADTQTNIANTNFVSQAATPGCGKYLDLVGSPHSSRQLDTSIQKLLHRRERQ